MIWLLLSLRSIAQSDKALLGGLDHLEGLALHNVNVHIIPGRKLFEVAVTHAVLLNGVQASAHILHALIETSGNRGQLKFSLSLRVELVHVLLLLLNEQTALEVNKA